MLPVLLVLQLVTSAPDACVDPAVGLRRLAAAHLSAELLAQAGSPRMAEAFTAYLRSGTREDYRAAQVRYEAKGSGRYNAARALVLGLIYASGPDLNPEGSAGYRHRLIEADAKAAAAALRHLGAAAAQDSAAWLPGVALAHVALAGREPQSTDAAFTALNRTLRQPGSPIVVRVALADLMIAAGKPATAVQLLTGHDSGCPGADAALGEALLQLGDSVRGARLIIRALERAPADQLDRFREDVATLLSPSELRTLNSLPETEVRTWLRDFWERSAAASARTLEGRLAAHAQRTARAHREYRLQTIRTSALAAGVVRGSPDIQLAQAGDPDSGPEALEQVAAQLALPWDARGLVHVRHGAPDTVIRSLEGQQIFVPENETWVYARANPPWLVHFGRYQGPDWFFLGPWIGCGDVRAPAMAAFEPGLGRRGNPRVNAPLASADRARQAVQASGPPGALLARDYYLARARLDERYDALAAHCAAYATTRRDPRAIATQVRDLARDYGEVVSAMLTTESARRPLRRTLRLQVAAYAFRDAAGTAELTSFAWVPAADVVQLPDDASLQLSFSLIGTAGRPVRFDTVATVRDGFQRDGAVLRMALRWPGALPPGATRLHVFAGDARDPERGAYADQRVAPVGSAPLAISSIVVAAPLDTGPLARGAHRIAPQPGHVVLVGEGFRLFYELYGIAADATLETTVRIRRVRGAELEGLLARFTGKRGQHEIRFRDVAEPDARGIVTRDVAIGGELVPGEYAVEVSVQTPGGELRGSTALRIHEP